MSRNLRNGVLGGLGGLVCQEVLNYGFIPAAARAFKSCSGVLMNDSRRQRRCPDDTFSVGRHPFTDLPSSEEEVQPLHYKAVTVDLFGTLLGEAIGEAKVGISFVCTDA